MEMLFDISISDFDIDSAVNAIKSSPLSNVYAENNLVDKIFELQNEQNNILDAAVSYAEEIYENSSRNISCKMSKVKSSGTPTIKASSMHLLPSGLDNSTGLISPSQIVSIYSSYYWRMGDYVEIINNSVVPATFNINLDAIMTREILESHFLRNLPKETLSRCMTSYLGSNNIESDDIHDERAINYSDLKRLFFLKTDTISVAFKIIHAPYATITELGIRGESFSLPYPTMASKIIARNGVVTFGLFREEFLLSGGYISDNSDLKKNAYTNSVVLGKATGELSLMFAPKIDWKAKDLRKSDRKDLSFMDSLASGVLDGIAPDSDNRGYHSIVCREELMYCINKIMGIIGDVRCSDDTEVSP